ncbi:MAG: hypothetical protein JO175_08760, partial [Candidatus Eremiobacteraeota bacterium]|nr:hypothetical protein [Candidatus Eremiobacteraeota bacterium]
VRSSHVGQTNARTNWLSAWLMGLAGNPFGTYVQEEPCVYCGHSLGPAPERKLHHKVLTKAAASLSGVQQSFVQPHAKWIHVLFEKRG